MVTATTGYAKFRDLTTGEDLTCNYYISDVIAAKITWNQQGAAASGSDTSVQFKNAVQLIDLATITGPTVMTGWNWYSGGVIVPSSATQLGATINTLNSRSFPRIGFKAGALISAIQF
jgi:hypothetical protein